VSPITVPGPLPGPFVGYRYAADDTWAPAPRPLGPLPRALVV